MLTAREFVGGYALMPFVFSLAEGSVAAGTPLNVVGGAVGGSAKVYHVAGRAWMVGYGFGSESDADFTIQMGNMIAGIGSAMAIDGIVGGAWHPRPQLLSAGLSTTAIECHVEAVTTAKDVIFTVYVAVEMPG